MRFKARIQDINLFLRLALAVEKIEKSCVVHLTPKKIQFILISDLTDGFQVWSGMNAASIFSEYKIYSKNQDEISFNVNLENLIRGLKSGQSAQEVRIQLTKKGGTAYLSMSIEVNPTKSMIISQDIPIQIISPSQLAAFTEPALPEPEVCIMMPPLKGLKNVIERMKNVDDFLIIQANMAGELTFKVRPDRLGINSNILQKTQPPPY
eukprot:TRINITY_DN4404_c0_g1_i2.p1 TRINITY_DN4404_c0_g1~~TRINITY_DN4404_c0_g1_i2.p1  ORF type:complete len:223 (-),score=33.44 TRINITY_DN4404_c0_g1_i2:347-970(-)